MSAISITKDYFKNIDLEKQKPKIYEFLAKIPHLKFTQDEVWQSRYWHKGVGAFQLEGKYADKPVIIKVQGPKPKISEAEIINFLSEIKNKKVKFPRVFLFKKRSLRNNFDIIIFEKVDSDFIIRPGEPASIEKIKKFLDAFSAYRQFLGKIKIPFIEKPKKFSYLDLFQKWLKIRSEHPLNKLISPSDDNFLKKTAERINKLIKNQPLVFQHCHLSIYDLKIKKNSYYIFSNLLWGWRWPFYDMVFGYNWHLLGLADYPKDVISKQMSLWENQLYQQAPNNSKRILIALAERYLASLNLDILMIGFPKKISKLKNLLIQSLKNKLKLL